MKQLRSVLREVKRRAKKEGKTITGGLLDIFYSGAPVAMRISAAKLIWDKAMIQISEGGEADNALGRVAVFLPAQHPHLTSIEGGKQK